MPDTTYLPWIPAGLALLAIAILFRVAAIADALHRQRLLAEQALAATRAEAEQSRSMLIRYFPYARTIRALWMKDNPGSRRRAMPAVP